MKGKKESIFTPAVKKHIDRVVDRLGMNFHLSPFRRAEAKANIMEYLWRNSRYYDPQRSEWYTFACLVVTSGAKRERVRLADEARDAQKFVQVSSGTDGDDELPIPDPRCDIDRLAFAMDLADVLARMPVHTAAILHAAVVEGTSFAEAAERFGHAPKAFYRRIWPRVRKDFLEAGGEFLRDS